MRIRIKILENGGKIFELRGEDLPAFVGSLPDATVCVADPLVDPLDCMIDGTRSGLRVTALSPHSATLLNGERVGEADLSSGDCLTVGGTCLLVDFAPRQPLGSADAHRTAVGSR